MAKMGIGNVIDARPPHWNFAAHKIAVEWLQNGHFRRIDCLRIGAARKIIRYTGLAIN